MKALIVKTSALGDIVQCFPALEYLRTKVDCIDWVTESSGVSLVQTHPHVRNVYVANTRTWRKQPIKHRAELRAFLRYLRAEHYDVVFDLQGNMKSGLITLAAKATAKVGFGLKTVPEWPNTLATNFRINPVPGQNARTDYLDLVRLFFGDKPPSQLAPSSLQVTGTPPIVATPYVLVCPGSVWKNKCIPTATLSAILQQAQNAFGFHYVIAWGSDEELKTANEIHSQISSEVLPKLPLATLQHLMRDAQLVLAMDSLPLHLAGETDTPAFGFFGPSHPNRYAPLTSGTFFGTCPYGETFTTRCKKLRTCPTGACLRQVTSDTLYNEFATWWTNR